MISLRCIIALLILAALLASGCTREVPPGPDSATGAASPAQPGAAPPAQPGATPSAQPTAPSAAGLMPRPDTPYSYHLSDGPAAEEYFVLDGERLIGSYNGNVYVTWFVTDRGVWRQDPGGPALLRYLPPTLNDNLAWKQTSGSEDVWFQLRQRAACDHPESKEGRDCWELTVLNRHERVLFRFVPNEGIVHVRSDNLANPAASYVKQRRQAQATAAPDRAQMLKAGSVRPPGPLPAITDVTPAEFASAMNALVARTART